MQATLSVIPTQSPQRCNVQISVTIFVFLSLKRKSLFSSKCREVSSRDRQDAVVPHNRVVFSISFKSVSGLPATMKGHVYGGKHRRLGHRTPS